MKRIIALLLIFVLAFAFTITLTSCNNETKEVRIIDFNDFTVNQIIIWSRRHNVSEKFDYYFDYSDTVNAGSFINSSLKAGDVIRDNVEIRVSLGAKIVSTGEDSFDPYSPFGPGPYSSNLWANQGIMPNIIGMKSEDAEAAIVQNGFKGDISMVTLPSDQKKGTVVDCIPNVGFPFDSYSYDNHVTLFISEGGGDAVNIPIPYSGESVIASVYVNGEFKREFTTIIGSSGNHSNEISVSGEGEALVKIILHTVGYDDSEIAIDEYFFIVNFDNGTYIETKNPDDPY